MAAMIVDSGARHLFLDAPAAANIEGQAVTAGDRIAMDGSDAGAPLDDWMAPAGTAPEPVAIAPLDGFNIIYSSGTTGTPHGIVHIHAMRRQHTPRGAPAYRPAPVNTLSPPPSPTPTMPR